MADVYQIRPLSDVRWNEFLTRHPRASVFHSAHWLSALQKTYGFEPFALTTSRPGESLDNALVFCCVNSPLTGRRLVSLPFSDHCASLVSGEDDLAFLTSAMQSQLADRRIRYAELRPVEPLPDSGPCQTTLTYRWHHLDLTADIDEIYGKFHRDCVVRKIRRAEREHLLYRKGSFGEYFEQFWNLHLQTRRRHSAPPQPVSWFRHLLSEFREEAVIHLAFQSDTPIAAIFTLEYKGTIVYKYGCSDPRLQALGGTQLLFWRLIQDAKSRGICTLDLGRSAYSNKGLIQFKDRWGAQASDLVYSRFTSDAGSGAGYRGRPDSLPLVLARRAISHLPNRLLAATGTLLYKHIA